MGKHPTGKIGKRTLWDKNPQKNKKWRKNVQNPKTCIFVLNYMYYIYMLNSIYKTNNV